MPSVASRCPLGKASVLNCLILFPIQSIPSSFLSLSLFTCCACLTPLLTPSPLSLASSTPLCHPGLGLEVSSSKKPALMSQPGGVVPAVGSLPERLLSPYHIPLHHNCLTSFLIPQPARKAPESCHCCFTSVWPVPLTEPGAQMATWKHGRMAG